ncbi:hypothetical protein Tco_1417293, partial [Tanacetum coccineum]
EQERLGFEVAMKLQAELDKEERQRISRAEGLIQELLQKYSYRLKDQEVKVFESILSK